MGTTQAQEGILQPVVQQGADTHEEGSNSRGSNSSDSSMPSRGAYWRRRRSRAASGHSSPTGPLHPVGPEWQEREAVSIWQGHGGVPYQLAWCSP